MFKELINLKLQRTALQALRFYISYVLLGCLLAVLVGMVFSGNIDFARNTVTIVMMIYVTAFYGIIMFQKNLFSSQKKLVSFGYILLGILAAFLTYSDGLVFSFVIIASLSTRKDNSITPSKENL